MFSAALNTIKELGSALGDRRTYSIRNAYAIFGLVWGLPIPVFSVGLDLFAGGRELTPREALASFSLHPVHFWFAAHPFLFAVVFGALGTVKFRQDSEIRRHAAELAAANEKLLELDRLKKDFVANVSHELKTPLVPVLGYAEMMLDGRLGDLNDRQRHGMEIALRNAERLKLMIDELLDIARIDSGRLLLEKKSFQLREILTAAARTFEAEFARLPLSFSLAMEDPDVEVWGDSERLRRVATNLLSNAVKFTPAGGSIEVRVSRPRDDGRVWVRVRDSGRGIPEKFRPYLFQRFSKASSTGSGGTGLGLAIAKAILDAHGSSIRLESREGAGTEVAFDLPASERQEEEEVFHEQPRIENRDGDRRRK